jgi:hypothetical protein
MPSVSEKLSWPVRKWVRRQKASPLCRVIRKRSENNREQPENNPESRPKSQEPESRPKSQEPESCPKSQEPESRPKSQEPESRPISQEPEIPMMQDRAICTASVYDFCPAVRHDEIPGSPKAGFLSLSAETSE